MDLNCKIIPKQKNIGLEFYFKSDVKICYVVRKEYKI